MLSLTFKNLWSRKWRSFMTALAVIFGIALVAGTYVLTDTTNAAFKEIFTESNKNVDVTITAKEQVKQEDGSTPAFSANLLKKVDAVSGVSQAAGSIFTAGAILDENGDSTGSSFSPQFISSTQPPDLESLDYIDGHPPRGPSEVTLDKAAFDRSDLKIGDPLRLVSTGPAKTFRIVGVTQLGGASFGGASIAQVTLPQAQKLTGKVGQFDQISVAGDSGTSPESLRDSIRKVMPQSVRVETGEENADRNASDIKDNLGFLTIALLAFAGISLFVGSFVIFNVFSITVAQRIREFGMLRTLGASRRQILRSVLIEGLLIGLFGSLMGILVGLALAKGLSALLNLLGASLPSTALVVESRTIIVSLVVGVGVTLVSSIIPAIRSTRVPPIAALSESAELGGKKHVLVRSIIAIVLALVGAGLIASVLISGADGGSAAGQLGAGAVLIVIAIFSPQIVKPMASIIGAPLQKIGGLTGRLARENSQRKPSRTAVTSAALMIGLALISFVTIFASGINSSISKVLEENITAEITLSGPGGFLDIPSGAVKAAAEVPGVQAASGLAVTQAKVDGDTAQVSGIEPSTADDVFDFEKKDGGTQSFADLKPGEAVIADGFASKHDLSEGDTFEVLSKIGKTTKLTVTGILSDDSLGLAGDVVVDKSLMVPDFGVKTDLNGFIKVADGDNIDKVQDEVKVALDKAYPTVDVLNQSEVKDNQRKQIDGLLALIYVLLALAIIVSLVGIIVTLILSIYERTRELGMLRAIGMSRRQVRRMIRYEAVITAVIGAVAGLILGVIFAFLIGIPLKSDGFALSYPVGQLFVILVLTALAGVLAAIYPARKASKLDVLEAVSYE
mgnify:CR=1 FL=1